MPQYPMEAYVQARRYQMEQEKKFNPLGSFGKGLGAGVETGIKSAWDESVSNRKMTRESVVKQFQENTPWYFNPNGKTLREQYSEMPADVVQKLQIRMLSGKAAPEGVKFIPRGKSPQDILAASRETGELKETGKQFLGEKPEITAFGFAPKEPVEDVSAKANAREAAKFKYKQKVQEAMGTDKTLQQLQIAFNKDANIANPTSLFPEQQRLQAQQNMLSISAKIKDRLAQLGMELDLSEIQEVVTPKTKVLGVSLPWTGGTEFKSVPKQSSQPWAQQTPAGGGAPSAQKGTPPPIKGFEGQKLKSKKTGIEWTYTNGQWQ